MYHQAVLANKVEMVLQELPEITLETEATIMETANLIIVTKTVATRTRIPTEEMVQ
jgi:hypothetical protein